MSLHDRESATTPAPLDELATGLVGLFPRLDAETRALALATYRHLARGAPVAPEALAGALGRDTAWVRAVLEGWPGVHWAEGRVVAFRGLSLAPTRHRMALEGRTLYTWCAWDTLFLPELLGETAQVASTCPESGHPVRLTVSPEELSGLEPPGAVLSLLGARPEMVTDLLARFCSHVFFFASEALGHGWMRDRPEALLLTVAEGHAVGRLVNRGRFGEALDAPAS